jgi:hypothetical protein
LGLKPASYGGKNELWNLVIPESSALKFSQLLIEKGAQDDGDLPCGEATFAAVERGAAKVEPVPAARDPFAVHIGMLEYGVVERLGDLPGFVCAASGAESYIANLWADVLESRVVLEPSLNCIAQILLILCLDREERQHSSGWVIVKENAPIGPDASNGKLFWRGDQIAQFNEICRAEGRLPDQSWVLPLILLIQFAGDD